MASPCCFAVSSKTVKTLRPATVEFYQPNIRANFGAPMRQSRFAATVVAIAPMPMNDEEEYVRRPLAYREEAFLQSADSRPLRILSEYLWPLSHFQEERIQDTVV